MMSLLTGVQLEVKILWHQLVDHHGNKQKIPLNTYDSLPVIIK